MFDLCLALGRWDVDGVAEEMPQRLFYEWQAYARLNPFGQARSDLQMAIIASTVANSGRAITATMARKKRYDPAKIADFLPDFRPKERKDGRQLFQELKAGLSMGFGLQRIKKPS